MMQSWIGVTVYDFMGPLTGPLYPLKPDVSGPPRLSGRQTPRVPT